ncbi:MAG: energy transducer TonB [Rhizomicrobium sp.]
MSAHSKPTQMTVRPSRGAFVRPRVAVGGGSAPLPPANGGAAHRIFRSRMPADLARYGMSAFVAVCLHAGIALICLLEWASTPAMPSQSAALIVDLAPMPSSPAAVFKDTPPGPHQVQSQPKPQPQQKPLKQPKIKQPPIMRGEVVLHTNEHKTPPAPPDRPPAPRSTDTPTSVAPKNDVAAAPASGTASDASRLAEESWEGEILAKLERAKRYPGLAQMRAEEDVVYLRFSVDRAGRVLVASIDHSRGFALLDDEVLSLIQRVQPLPPPPSQVKGDSIELVVPVDFFIKQRGP